MPGKRPPRRATMDHLKSLSHEEGQKPSAYIKQTSSESDPISLVFFPVAPGAAAAPGRFI